MDNPKNIEQLSSTTDDVQLKKGKVKLPIISPQNQKEMTTTGVKIKDFASHRKFQNNNNIETSKKEKCFCALCRKRTL